MSISFVFGKPPPNPLIDSEPGWSRIAGYDDSMPVVLRSVCMGLALAVTLAIAWRLLVQDALLIEGRPSGWSVVQVFLIATAGHELCHLLLFPRLGTQHTVVGMWLQMGALFVQHLRPMNRNRLILATLSPTILICLPPLAAAVCGVNVPPALQWASVANGVAVGADLLAVTQMLRHVPASSLVLDSAQGVFQHEA